MTTFKAVLFDLDGTVAKTMESYFDAWKKACEDFGFKISESDYYPLEGMKAEELALTLCRKCGGDDRGVAKIVERKKYYFIKMFSGSKAKLYPGVKTTLNALTSKKTPVALVTASVMEQVKASVSEEFLKKFTALVTGEIGGRGKPFPDPYLKGAELLGVNPNDCIAVENAPLGVKSAKAAGMCCVAVAHTVPRENLNEADVVLPVFEELSKFFENIGI